MLHVTDLDVCHEIQHGYLFFECIMGLLSKLFASESNTWSHCWTLEQAFHWEILFAQKLLKQKRSPNRY